MQYPLIDAVITWVDGDDPAHKAKMVEFIPKSGATRGADPTRFASVDEIIYCVLSIMKYAPYFNKIYIVTDSQTPPVFEAVKSHFPDQIGKIVIIDHKDIFVGFEECLPTFNSTSIITALHRIENLCEHFVYFNDDFFLVRPTSPEDWFVDGKPILRGRWFGKSLEYLEILKSGIFDIFLVPKRKRRINSEVWQLKSAQTVGFEAKCFIASHTPYCMRRSTLKSYFDNHPELFLKNVSYRFRDSEQFIPEAVSNHLEIINNTAQTISDKELVYVSAFRASIKNAQMKIRAIETDENIKFICLQSLDQATPPVQKLLLDWLRERTRNDTK